MHFITILALHKEGWQRSHITLSVLLEEGRRKGAAAWSAALLWKPAVEAHTVEAQTFSRAKLGL
jgi:hypothetical protein